MAMIAITAAVEIGSLLLSYFLRPKIAGQSPLQDLQVSSSADGAAIVFGYGINRFAGQVIWSPGITYKYDKEGGSFFGGDPHIGQYVYSASFAAAFGEGPATFNRIWGDSKLIYKGGEPFGSFAPWSAPQAYAPEDLVSYQYNPGSGNVTAIFQCLLANTGKTPPGNSLYWSLTNYAFHDNAVLYWPGAEVAYPGSATSSPGSGNIYACVVHSQGDNPSSSSRWKLLSAYYSAPALYPGDQLQNPDPLISSVQGAATTPAYRGLTYAVWDNFPLANFGNRVPNLRAEINFGTFTIAQMVTDICGRAGLS